MSAGRARQTFRRSVAFSLDRAGADRCFRDDELLPQVEDLGITASLRSAKHASKAVKNRRTWTSRPEAYPITRPETVWIRVSVGTAGRILRIGRVGDERFNVRMRCCGCRQRFAARAGAVARPMPELLAVTMTT